jgi:hypothetical protein
MRFQPAPAKLASGVKSLSRACDVDFTGDAPAEPTGPRALRDAAHIRHFPDKLMTQDTAKCVIAAKDFDVGVADSRETNADERPSCTELRQRLSNGSQSMLANDECEHFVLLDFSEMR